jgi:mannose-1-phosphate guanylyltransferase
MLKIKPIIMAGGLGTRLWPASLNACPKQFVKTNGCSLFQQTLIRNKSFGKLSVIICEDHKIIVQQQIHELGIEADIIIEPIRKSTASCAIISAFLAKEDGADIVLLLPSDHHILNLEAYLSTIHNSFTFARDIVTIGVQPTYPNVGYGYIKVKKSIIAPILWDVEEFIEKPDIQNAKIYLNQGNYFWNSGIFIYNPDSMLNLIKQSYNSLFNLTKESFFNAKKDSTYTWLDEAYYNKISPISLDYLIMKHTSSMILLEAKFDWSDLGSWDSLWQISEKDDKNNSINGDIIALDVTNSYIHSDQGIVAAIGLDNAIIINKNNMILVADRLKAQGIREAVNQIGEIHGTTSRRFTQVPTPWGYYQIIENNPLCKVKRIIVYPKQKLSLQSHYYRTEHWVIISGVAETVIGDKIAILSNNDSAYIPKGVKHRLSNIGDKELHLIEIQVGQYLEEDDITRYSDVYGRE